MQPKKRIFQIRQRQLRRRKNVSFKQLSVGEQKMVRNQQMRLYGASLLGVTPYLERGRGIRGIESLQQVNFNSLIGHLRRRFPSETIEVLDEGSGESSLKESLMKLDNVTVTRTDVMAGPNWPDKHADVIDLVKVFGKNKFHLVNSCFGGAFHTPLKEKAIFQIVSVLKPGGVAIVITKLPEEELKKLSKRFNISIKSTFGVEEKMVYRVLFTKNFGRSKKR